MKILSVKPGHDGCIAFVSDGELVYSLEAEKDSFQRNGDLGAHVLADGLELALAEPDIIAIGGWHKVLPGRDVDIGAGYFGLGPPMTRPSSVFGRRTILFSSSRERSHILMATAMYPRAPVEECAILVWEGRIGSLYHWRNHGASIRCYPVMNEPGARYSALFALAEPNFPLQGANPQHEYAGKMMALTGYYLDHQAEPDDLAVVERLLSEATFYPFNKGAYASARLFNCGPASPRFSAAARYLSDRLFEQFRRAAEQALPAGLPLLISGGCALNCDWNSRWRRLGYFSDVFAPPCANDSGTAIGTAVDAMVHFGSPCRLEWSVYSGADFTRDSEPPSDTWTCRPKDDHALAATLFDGQVIAWIQGRYEIGPRALGNRSLLASPLSVSSRDLLNYIKERESYRPIAPSCLREELTCWFDDAIDDPYMLHFCRVKSTALPAITHVDGTARLQSVAKERNPELHELLLHVRDRTGYGVLCNTSLNFKGRGFINRTSDLLEFCDQKKISHIVIGDLWYSRRTH